MAAFSLLKTALALCLLAPLAAEAETAPPDREALTASLQKIVDDYLADNATTEKLTAISASVSLDANTPNINVVAGRVSREAGASLVTPDHLYPIGSITKSMTSTVVLQLVREGVLSLDAPIGIWLPEYPAWHDVTLRRLLNMTSGIPSYDLTEAFVKSVVRGGITRHYSPAVLLSFADPDLPGAPVPTTGYNYANINYILAQVIIERATGRSLDEQIRERLLTGGHRLDNTFYSSGPYPDSVLSRTVSCYMAVADPPMAAPLVGVDLKFQDPSWAQGAGAAIATPQDVTRWARLLYQGTILGEAERSKLTKLVSMISGAPVAETTTADPRAFGLGVAQTIVDKVRFWYYQGEPMGSRVFYGYFPEKDLVIAIGVNSAAAGEDLGFAVIKMYEAVTGETVVMETPALPPAPNVTSP